MKTAIWVITAVYLSMNLEAIQGNEEGLAVVMGISLCLCLLGDLRDISRE